MPQNLDEDTRNGIFWTSAIVDAYLVGMNIFLIARVLQPKQRKDVSILLWGCLKTLLIMGILSHFATEALVGFGEKPASLDVSNTYNLSSSINFCENDFVRSQYVAEPANSMSSLTTFCPLALLGLHLLPKQLTMRGSEGRLRFTLAYLSLLLIGLGSFWLHSELTATAQAGDELPMLWHVGSLAFITADCLLHNRSTDKHRTSLWLVGFSCITSIVATLTYVFNREDFFIFNSMVTSYVVMVLGGEAMLLFSDLSKFGDSDMFRGTVLLPIFSCNIWVYLSASFLWVSEMLYCHDAITDMRWGSIVFPWIFDRAIHAGWHCTSSLLAFLTIQTLLAVWGFQQRWGEPQLKWFGVPYVSFEKVREE